MALTKEQWRTVTDSMATLRALGCAVCVFTPDDVESAEREDGGETTPEQAADWMSSNRKWLEDGMSTFGNQYIADNLDEIAKAA